MKAWMRYHQYAFRIALRRLLKQPFSSLCNLFVISISLALPLLAASILVSVQPIVQNMPVTAELTLLLTQESSLSQAQSLANDLRDGYPDNVFQTRVIDRAEALEQLSGNPAWSEALAVLTDNPLPHAIVITLRDGTNQASMAASLAQQWRDLKSVQAVQLDSDWVRRLEALLSFLRIGLGLLAIAVALVVIATVFNTVRMQALTQRDEISVARLVGATEAFVRRPFLYMGALTGIMSGFIAIGAAILALIPLNHALSRLAATYQTQILLQLPAAPDLAAGLFVIAALAAFAARWSVTRNTRF